MTTLDDTVQHAAARRRRPRRARRGLGRARAQARVGRDQVGVRALRRRPRARGVVPGLRAHRRRGRRPRPASRSCSSTRSTTSRRRSGTSNASASATTSTSRSWSRSSPPDDLWQTDTDECCAMRKVEPLARALAGQAGVDERACAGSRRRPGPRTQIVHLDVGRGIVKVNPLARWTDDDIATYKRDHDLLEHPLVGAGLPVDRLLAVHPARRARRRPALGPLGRDRQDRVRPARLAAALSCIRLADSVLLMHGSASHTSTRSKPSRSTSSARSRPSSSGPCLLFSGGKDSVVMLHVAEKAFWPARAAVPGDARRHRPQLPRGDRVPRRAPSNGSTSASSSRRCRSRSTRAASSRTPARARRATGCRPRRCSTRSRSTSSTR